MTGDNRNTKVPSFSANSKLAHHLYASARNSSSCPPVPITPVFFPDEQTTVKAADVLYEKGIYVRAFTYPVVPKGKARIRVQLSAAHTKRHLDRALGAFEAISS